MLVGVEPADAACVLEAVRDGEIVVDAGPHGSIMAGLNCGLPSSVAWPPVRDGIDVLRDRRPVAVAGMKRLAALGLAAGECSGGTAGAAAELMGDEAARAELGVGDDSTVLALLTEGITNPDDYEKLMG